MDSVRVEWGFVCFFLSSKVCPVLVFSSFSATQIFVFVISVENSFPEQNFNYRVHVKSDGKLDVCFLVN